MSSIGLSRPEEAHTFFQTNTPSALASVRRDTSDPVLGRKDLPYDGYVRAMIIGLTGTNGSGKTVAAEHLQKKGFRCYSLSDVIREELAARGLRPTRENLIAEGNRLRSEFGPAVLARRISRKFRLDQNYVVDSIRTPQEVGALRECGAFHLLHLDAPRDVRYERALRRGGNRVPASFSQFREQEERELESSDPSRQQLRSTWKEADRTLLNAGSIQEFRDNLTEITKGWMMEPDRPGWDEYFMRIAQIAALRSNCMKRKVAAVLVKDRRIISTGYNGTPRGVANCNEGGCPRCNSLADSGTRLDECLCSHAEENAIVQAAYHGTSVKGATVYSTCSPCLICTKMIINAGITRVVYNLDYPLHGTANRLLAEAGVELHLQSLK